MYNYLKNDSFVMPYHMWWKFIHVHIYIHCMIKLTKVYI